jgi:SAM-dependent methyltransferase
MRRQHQRLMIGGLAAGVTVFGTLAVTAPFVFMRSPLPFMATPGHKVRKALAYVVHQKANACASTRFVDLGSGDGQAVYEAVRLGYRSAVGIELNYTLYAIAQCRRLFWTADEQKRSKFMCQDMFDYNLAAADTILIFGVNPLMKPLSQKLARECQTGAHVLSYRFILPTDTSATISSNLLSASLIYTEEDMRIYSVHSHAAK